MSAARLSNAALARLAARGVRTPQYDRSRTRTGVLHFGPGAFHRVHQACYLDDALTHDPRWGVVQVSLHSAGVRDALMEQDGLYTIAVLDEASTYRVIGAVKQILVAPESPAAVLERLADPAISLVTITVTEKGYCLGADGALDMTHPDIAHDLASPAEPRSLIGYLAAGLARRHKLGTPPPNVVSCDNLTDNGGRLRRAVLDFAGRLDPQLERWIAAEAAFPSTMVDSITPATDDALRARVAQALGVEDRWPVQREAFMQWVVEDSLRGPQPDWSALGVVVTDDVAAFERAKLRLLNGAHSTLAYMGLLAGRETVADAMRAPELAQLVRTLMIEDVAPSLRAPRGLDIARYIEAILQRFRNPALRHLLSQIAWDGSQKLPFRLMGTIRDALEAGRPIDRLCTPLAAWMLFVRRKVQTRERLVDPLATQLLALGAACTGEPSHDATLFLRLESVFPRDLAQHSEFIAAVVNAYRRLAG